MPAPTPALEIAATPTPDATAALSSTPAPPSTPTPTAVPESTPEVALEPEPTPNVGPSATPVPQVAFTSSLPPTPAPTPAPSHAPDRGAAQEDRRAPRSKHSAPAPRTTAPDASAPQRSASPVGVAAAVTTAPATSADSLAAEPRSGRARGHVVRSGESLWSIAVDALAPGAPEVQVARAVAVLWQMNRARIQSANPDILAIGTRLSIPTRLDEETRR
ncbi:MAG: LysM domain-containing protein [Patulibacter sp.]